MTKTQFSLDQLRAGAVKPLFAVAGATELAVDLARGYAAEAQKAYQGRLADAQSRFAKVDRDPKALQAQARTLVNARVDELTKEAKDAQAKFEARIAELQKDAKAVPGRFQTQLAEAVSELTATYAELATRGEKFVAAIRKDGYKAVTAVRKAPSSSTVVRREKARTAAAKPATKKTATRKPAAKKTATKKSTAKKSTSTASAGTASA